MPPRRSSRTLEMTVENLEGRMVLSTAASGAHALAQAHATQIHVAQSHAPTTKTPTIPNPVLVTLTPGVDGIKITDVSYDSRINLITIKGSIETTVPPPNPYGYYPPTYGTDFVTVVASQSVDRLHSVSGSQYSSVPVSGPSVSSVNFTEKVLASSGKFTGGNVQISISVAEFDYNYINYSVIAKMRNAKAY